MTRIKLEKASQSVHDNAQYSLTRKQRGLKSMAGSRSRPRRRLPLCHDTLMIGKQL